jgi:hypothetical protein
MESSCRSDGETRNLNIFWEYIYEDIILEDLEEDGRVTLKSVFGNSFCESMLCDLGTGSLK